MAILRRHWLLLVVATFLCTDLAAQQAANSTGKGNTTEDSAEVKRHNRMLKLAQSFVVYTDDGGKNLAKLREQPIFRWANPQREAIGGALFLWTHRGRPHATIGIWTYDDTEATDSYEVQSFSEQPFRTKSTTRTWSPRTPGIRFRPLDTRQRPAASKTRRLVQMRQLGRKYFSAKTNPDTRQEEKLRFLPAPVYRYEELPEGVIDGAMFSFAQGTDPEVFLVLEARESKGNKNWYFAIGNQTSVQAQASLMGKAVWNSGQLGDSFQMVMRRN